jgi:nucleoside-diphosphate-sugar epimerase
VTAFIGVSFVSAVECAYPRRPGQNRTPETSWHRRSFRIGYWGHVVVVRVVIVGASGNIGTSLLDALANEDRVDSVLGLARRLPESSYSKTEWASADVRTDDLEGHFHGADVVVHLAWAIQPSHDAAALRSTNVEGSRRVFEAVARARVPALVYASSVGTYSAGPKDRAVDESWPVDGIATSFYSRHKAEVEAMLARFEREHPGTRVVRFRPALVFKAEAATGIRRLFIGPFLPTPLLRRSLLPVVPAHERLRFQGVHSKDVGDAFRRAIVGDVSGPFNLASEPVLDGQELARMAGAKTIRVAPRVLRAGAAVTWRLHLQPSPPGWVDLAYGVPIMDSSRAKVELGWSPNTAADDALGEVLAGMRTGKGLETPPLSPRTSGHLRAKEIKTGIGEKD